MTVGVEGSRIKDPAALSATLLAAGATAAEVQRRLHGGVGPPDLFRTGVHADRGPIRATGRKNSTLYESPARIFNTRRPARSSLPGWPPTSSAPSGR